MNLKTAAAPEELNALSACGVPRHCALAVTAIGEDWIEGVMPIGRDRPNRESTAARGVERLCRIDWQACVDLGSSAHLEY